jgi:hypothetical protein
VPISSSCCTITSLPAILSLPGQRILPRRESRAAACTVQTSPACRRSRRQRPTPQPRGRSSTPAPEEDRRGAALPRHRDQAVATSSPGPTSQLSSLGSTAGDPGAVDLGGVSRALRWSGRGRSRAARRSPTQPAQLLELGGGGRLAVRSPWSAWSWRIKSAMPRDARPNAERCSVVQLSLSTDRIVPRPPTAPAATQVPASTGSRVASHASRSSAMSMRSSIGDRGDRGGVERSRVGCRRRWSVTRRGVAGHQGRTLDGAAGVKITARSGRGLVQPTPRQRSGRWFAD